MTTTDPLLTVAQAAKKANVSPTTIRRRIAAGEVQALRLGTNQKAPLRIDPDRFSDWVYSRRTKP